MDDISDLSELLWAPHGARANHFEWRQAPALPAPRSLSPAGPPLSPRSLLLLPFPLFPSFSSLPPPEAVPLAVGDGSARKAFASTPSPSAAALGRAVPVWALPPPPVRWRRRGAEEQGGGGAGWGTEEEQEEIFAIPRVLHPVGRTQPMSCVLRATSLRPIRRLIHEACHSLVKSQSNLSRSNAARAPPLAFHA